MFAVSTSHGVATLTMRRPPVNVYSLSHHEQRRLQAVSRTNTQGRPA